MSKLEICPICCEGNLQPYFFSKELKYKNITCHAKTFQACKCDICGSSVANSEQTKANKLMAINFERSVDGFLHTDEISKIRKQLSLSQRKASAIVCGGGNSFAKYESGAVKQSAAVDNLLRILRDNPATLAVLVEADEQRRAISSVREEIFLPAPLAPNEPEESPIFTIVKGFVSAAQTIFFPELSNCEKSPNAVKFNLFGLPK